MSKIIPFLQEIAQNNNREWFNDNKKNYKEALLEFETLMQQLIESISLFDRDISELTPKSTIFRIYRDTRFSHNKQPYKTHFGAYMAKKGRKSQYAGYYLHIEPGSSFLGGGLYRPDTSALKKIRQQIDYNADELRKIINHSDFKQTFGTMEGEKLKTSPRDYSPDHPDIDLLNHKDFVATTPFDPHDIIKPDFIEFCTTKFKALNPLINYLNHAIEYIDEEPEITF